MSFSRTQLTFWDSTGVLGETPEFPSVQTRARFGCGGVMRKLALRCVAALLIAAGAYGQGGGNAAMTGTVTDPSGASITQARAIMTQVGTDVKRSATTNAAGQFFIPSLPPATYRMTVVCRRVGYIKGRKPAQNHKTRYNQCVFHICPIHSIIYTFEMQAKLCICSTAAWGGWHGQNAAWPCLMWHSRGSTEFAKAHRL